VDVFWGTQGRS